MFFIAGNIELIIFQFLYIKQTFSPHFTEFDRVFLLIPHRFVPEKIELTVAYEPLSGFEFGQVRHFVSILQSLFVFLSPLIRGVKNHLNEMVIKKASGLITVEASVGFHRRREEKSRIFLNIT